MTRLDGIPMCSFRFIETLLSTELRDTMEAALGGGSARLMRRIPLPFALSTTVVIAATTMQVIVMAALRPLSAPVKGQKPLILKSARRYAAQT